MGIEKFFVFLIIFVLTLSFFSNAYAEITYSSNLNRVKQPPTYCYVEPTDSEISYIQKGQWANEVEKSVKEWNSKLQASEPTNKQLWTVKYLGSGKEPLSNCDYPIYFKPWPAKSEDWFRVAGHFFYTNIIKIYFLGWSFCEVDDELVQCFNWSMIKTGPQQGGTIKHEIGHSLGLDHYFSDNPEVTAKWSILSILPSVMISGINNHADVKQVTDTDIQKVRSVYGSKGFLAFSPEPTPKLPTPPPIPKPIPKFVPPKIPTQPFERIDITSSKIEVEKYSTEMIKIIGDISKEEFLKGHDVYLTLKKPDGSTETLKITPTRKGHFETTLVFDNDSMRGFYEVWAIYLEQRDRNMDIVFEVVTAGKQTTTTTLEAYRQDSAPKEIEKSTTVESESIDEEQTIPDWVRTNAEWWGTDVISDDEFISAIQYMIKENILKIPPTEQGTSSGSNEIPAWIKNNALWWADGLIDDDSFIQGIQYMVEIGIIQVS